MQYPRYAAALFLCFLPMVVAGAAQPDRGQAPTLAADSNALRVRQRYEEALLRNPFQERAFQQTYEGYLEMGGVPEWEKKLRAMAPEAADAAPFVLLGRIYARQFRLREAVEVLEEARARGENRPGFHLLLGDQYYQLGKNEEAIALLSAAIEQIEDQEVRAGVCRTLGALYMRLGKREQAIETWERLTELNPGDLFAQLELAETYEDNAMWEQALGVYTAMAAATESDAYRRCRALRSAARCQLRLDRHADAIVSIETALDLVAPGNWLFTELKRQLVAIYDDLGNLEGLRQYLAERLKQNPADAEFRAMLAETCQRLGDNAGAEEAYNEILARDPSHLHAREGLIALYRQDGRMEDLAAQYEALIERRPSDYTYVRRLGEAWLREGDVDRAKSVWRRLVDVEDAPADAWARLAAWFEEGGFPAEAEEAYTRALEQRAERDWVLSLARVLHDKGDEEGALAQWLRLADLEEATGEECAEVATILETRGYPEQAGACYAKAHAKAPDSTDIRLKLALNLAERKAYEPALPHLEALATDSGNAYAQRRAERALFSSWQALGLLDEKRQALEAAAAVAPADTDAQLKLARFYLQAGARQPALELLEGCREAAPEDTQCLRELGELYGVMGQTQKAAETWRKLIELEPGRARAYYQELSFVYTRSGQQEALVETAQKIVELTPDEPEARLRLATAYRSAGKTEEALREFRTLLRLAPDNADYCQAYGDTLAADDRLGEARDAYRRMLDAAGTEAVRLGALNKLAGIHLRLGAADELVREFAGKVRATPERLGAHTDLAEIYQYVGRTAQAVETLERALTAVEDEEAVLRELVRVCSNAMMLDKVVQYHEALLARSAQPDPSALESLGRAYVALGRDDEALATWRRITEANPDDLQALWSLVRILQMNGFVEDALELHAEALERDPQNYQQRFAYAQALQQQQRLDEAMDQLYLILELGPPDESAPTSGAPAAPVGVPLYMPHMMPGMPYGPYYGGYFPGVPMGGAPGGRNAFAVFRQQVLAQMTYLARNTFGVEALVKEFEDRREAEPDNLQRTLDLITICQSAQNLPRVQSLLRDAVAKNPDDLNLLQQLAGTLQQPEDIEEGVALYRKLAEADETNRVQYLTMTAQRYLAADRRDEARAAAAEIEAAVAGDPARLDYLANLYTQLDDMEKAESLYRRAIEENPQRAHDLTRAFAAQLERAGRADEARALNLDLLFQESVGGGSWRAASARSSRNVPVPSDDALANGWQQILSSLTGGGFSQGMHQRQQLLETLVSREANIERRNEVLARMEGVSRELPEAKDAARQQLAAEMTALLFAWHAANGDMDQAAQKAGLLKAWQPNSRTWLELEVQLLGARRDYEGVDQVYQDMQRQGWVTADQLELPRAKLAELQGDAAAAAGHYLRAARKATTPDALVGLLQSAAQAGQGEAARKAAEEYLASKGRPSQVLTYLANVYAADLGLTERAWDLYKEAWENQGRRGAQNPGYYSSSYYGGFSPSYLSSSLGYWGGGYHPMGSFRQHRGNMPLPPTLDQWWRLATQLGRDGELLERFEQRLEQQPGDIANYTTLAALYDRAGRGADMLRVYGLLAKQRPNHVQGIQEYAALQAELGSVDDAIATLQALRGTQRRSTRAVDWQLRELYARAGKEEEKEKLETQMIASAQSEQAIRELVQQYEQAGEIEKAIEACRKLVSLSRNPEQATGWLARLLTSAGACEEALEIRRKAIEAAGSSPGNQTGAIREFVALSKQLGRLPALKEEKLSALSADPENQNLRIFAAYITFEEGRYPEALAQFKALADSTRLSFENELRELYPLAGDREGMLALLEKDLEQQRLNDNQVDTYIRLSGREDEIIEILEAQERRSHRGAAEVAGRVMQALGRANRLYQAADYYRKTRPAFQSSQNYGVHNLDEWALRNIADPAMASAVRDVLGQLDERALSDLLKRRRYELQRYPEGRRIVEELSERYPENGELLEFLAEFQRRTGQEGSGAYLDTGRRLAEAKPEDRNAQENHAQALVRVGREREAVDHYLGWVRANPAPANLRAAVQFLEQRGYRRTLAALREEFIPKMPDEAAAGALGMDPGQAPGNTGAQPRRAGAKEQFESTPSANTFENYIQELMNYQKQALAYQLYEEHRDAPFMKEWKRDSRYYMGIALAKDDPDEVAGILLDALRNQPRHQPSPNIYNLHQAPKGALRETLSVLEERLFATEETSLRVLNGLAGLWQMAGDTERVLGVHERILASYPDDLQSLAQKPRLLAKLGRQEEALTLWPDLIARVPHGQIAQYTLEYASLLQDAGREAEALALVDQLTAQDRTACAKAAAFYTKAGRPEKALQSLEDALETGAEIDRATLVHAYLAAGDIDKALENLPADNYHILDNAARDAAEPAMRARLYLEYYRHQDHVNLSREFAEACVQCGDWSLFLDGFRCALDRRYDTHYHTFTQAMRVVAESGHAADVLGLPEAEADPEFRARLGLALITAVNRSQAPATVQMILPYLDDLQDYGDMVVAAEALANHERTDAAAEWWARVMDSPGATPRQRWDAARNLTSRNDTDADLRTRATGVMVGLLDVWPSQARDEWLIQQVRDSDNAEWSAKLRESLEEFLDDDQSRAYYDLLFGDSEVLAQRACEHAKAGLFDDNLDPRLRQRLVDHLVRGGCSEEALRLLDLAVEAARADHERANLQQQILSIAIRAEDYDRAIKAYEAAIEAGGHMPVQPHTCVQLAIMLADKGEAAKGDAIIEALPLQTSYYPDIWNLARRYYLLQGREDDYAAFCENLIDMPQQAHAAKQLLQYHSLSPDLWFRFFDRMRDLGQVDANDWSQWISRIVADAGNNAAARLATLLDDPDTLFTLSSRAEGIVHAASATGQLESLRGRVGERMARFPKDSAAKRFLAELRLFDHDITGALPLFEELATGDDARHAESRRMFCLELLGDPDRLREALEARLADPASSPDLSKAFQVSDMLRAAGDPVAADLALDRLLMEHKASTQLVEGLAQRGRLDLAEEALNLPDERAAADTASNESVVRQLVQGHQPDIVEYYGSGRAFREAVDRAIMAELRLKDTSDTLLRVLQNLDGRRTQQEEIIARFQAAAPGSAPLANTLAAFFYYRQEHARALDVLRAAPEEQLSEDAAQFYMESLAATEDARAAVDWAIAWFRREPSPQRFGQVSRWSQRADDPAAAEALRTEFADVLKDRPRRNTVSAGQTLAENLAAVAEARGRYEEAPAPETFEAYVEALWRGGCLHESERALDAWAATESQGSRLPQRLALQAPARRGDMASLIRSVKHALHGDPAVFHPYSGLGINHGIMEHAAVRAFLRETGASLSCREFIGDLGMRGMPYRGPGQARYPEVWHGSTTEEARQAAEIGAAVDRLERNTPPANLRMAIEAELARAELLRLQGDGAGADAVMDALGTWARDGQTQWHAAQFLMKRERYEEAIRALDDAARMGYRATDPRLRIEVLARMGRTAEALDCWRAHRSPEIDGRVRYFAREEGIEAFSKAVYDTLQAEGAVDHQLLRDTADLAMRQGRTSDAWTAFAEGYRTACQSGAATIASLCANFIVDQKAEAEALAHARNTGCPCTTAAFVKAFERLATGDKPDRVAALADKAATLSPEHDADRFLLGKAFQALGHGDEAAAHFASLGMENRLQVRQAIERLAELEAWEAAGPLASRYADAYPRDALTDANVLRILANTRDASGCEAALAPLTGLPLPEERKAFLHALTAYYREPAAGVDALAALANASDLTYEDVVTLHECLEAGGRADVARALACRMAEGGFSAEATRRFCLLAARPALESGQFDDAAAYAWDALTPGHEPDDETAESLAAALTADKQPGYRAAVVARLREHPANWRCASLASLYCTMARAAGTEENAAELLVEAGAAADQVGLARTWQGLIRHWFLGEIGAEGDGALRPCKPAHSEAHPWAGDPAMFQTLNASGMVAFIGSPDARTVTLDFSAPGTCAIYLNGSRIWHANEQAPVFFGDERLTCSLEPGLNQLRALVPSARDGAAVAVSIVKGREGLRIEDEPPRTLKRSGA